MNILLIDDSRSARFALRQQLQKYNINVETADTAEAGLEILNGNKPDAILMDHMMPGMSGFEALELVKANPQTAHIPVIMCTSNEDPEYESEAVRRGAMAILPKALASEKLPHVLQDISERLRPRPAEPVATPSRPTTAVAEQATAAAPSDTDFRAFVAGEIKALRASLLAEIDGIRNEIPEPDINQVHEAVGRLEHEVLPRLVQESVHVESSRILDTLEKKVDQALTDSFDALVEGLPRDQRVVGPLLEAAQALVETKAMEVAKSQARVAGEAAGVEQASRVARDVAQTTEQAIKRAHLTAVGAGLVGIAAAILVYLLR